MFEKGNKIGKGRPKGSPNKSTSEIKEKFQLLLDDNLPDIQEWIDDLESKDKIRVILDLASYVIPRIKASEIKFEPEPTQPLFLMPEEFEAMKKISNEAFKQVTGRDKSCIDGYED